MPFCIIFFVVLILYSIILEKNIFNKFFFILLSVLGTVSVFLGNVNISKDIQINVILLIALFLLLLYSIIKTKGKLIALSFIIACSVGVAYYYLINANIFYSIDYGVYYIVAFASIFAIVFSFNINLSIFTSVLITLSVAVGDGVFWFNELKYVSLNNINLLNMLLLLITISIGFNRLICIYKEKKYEKVV